MYRIRRAVLVGVSLLASTVLLLSAAGAEPPPKPPDEDSDNIVPVAASVQVLRNVELSVDGAKLNVSSIEYAQQGTTVYLFPVWVVLHVETLSKTGGGWEEVSPVQPLPTKADGAAPRLRVQLANLLAQENTRTAVEKRLREHVADSDGVKAEQVKLRSPTFKRQGFRIALAAPGTTDDSGEVSLSRTVIVPPEVAENNGPVNFDLLPENIAALQATNAEPVLLRGAYLKLSGQMKSSFEKQQYLVNFQVVQTAVASLQNDLKSIQPTGQPAPEVFVQVPVGGTVEGKSAVTAVFNQYLIGSISIREGAHVDPGLVNELAERLLGRILSQIELAQMEDGKRVAVMLGDRATLSATVGEIKSLAKQTKAEREDKLKAALDDMESRRIGQKSEYMGSVATQWGPIGGKVDAAYANATDDEKTARRKQEMETMNRGLDELEKRFDGRLPTLSGIQFDQKALDESVKEIQVEFEGKSRKPGWSQHDWAGIKLTTTAGLAVSPELLLRQVDEAQTRYATFEKLLGAPEKVKELQGLLSDARKATEQAKATADRVAEMEKRGTPTEVEQRLKGLEFRSQMMVPRIELKGLEDASRFIAFSPDSSTVAIGGSRNMARLWDVRGGIDMGVLKGHTDWVLCVAFSPDGKTVATGSRDETARLWEAPNPNGFVNGAEIKTNHVLKGHTHLVFCVAFSPDGKTVATGSGDNTARLWDAATGAERVVLKGHTDGVLSVAFSPDGKTVATGSGDNTARVWDATTGAEKVVLKGHTYNVASVVFSPNGQTLATASNDHTVRLWDAASGAQKALLEEHADYGVRSMAFSPDGKVVVTSSNDRSARLWDVATGAEKLVLKGHTAHVHSVAFSPDGKMVATGSNDLTTRLWDAATGAEMAVLKGRTANVNSIAFSPDGRTLVTASEDHTARLWDLQP